MGQRQAKREHIQEKRREQDKCNGEEKAVGIGLEIG
jgi:hypothetical protein